jgi:hypothetical protein
MMIREKNLMKKTIKIKHNTKEKMRMKMKNRIN